MKLSVSVPDDLWDQAKALGGDAQSSHLIQQALRRYVEDGGSKPAYSTSAPADIADALQTVQKRFAEEAREEFERGYRAAVTAFPKLQWSDIEFLANTFRFDVKRWARNYRDIAEDVELRKGEMTPGYVSHYPPDVDVNVETVKALMEAIGGWVAPFDMAEWSPRPTYARGFTQAMRDLWRTINEGYRGPQDQGGEAKEEGV